MPYNNWDIPAELFSISPVGRQTINNFIGRDSLVQKIKKLIESKDIRVIFEGEIGTGKTSLGNYIRFTQSHSFTTDIEIMCQAHWTSREFLLALQSSIIATCKKDLDYNALLREDLFARILERNSNIRISNYQGGVSVLGHGASLGHSESVSHPINLDDQTLISELNEILMRIKEEKSKLDQCDIDLVRIIFQINNLDPAELPFTEDKIVVFLNSIRDIITDKVDASFIINGASGLKALINKRVKRLAPCVMFEKVRPLSKDELIEALQKRIENSGHNGDIPFEFDLVEALYESTHGNFRGTLGLMETLSIYYDSEEPLMNNITLEDCFNYYFMHYAEEVQDIAVRATELTNKGKILKALSDNPMLNVSDLALSVGIQQGNTSKLLGELEAEGVLVKSKDSSSVRCILSPNIYFASKTFFQGY